MVPILLVLSMPVSADTLPWQEAGLTERAAAAHLLDRFTYGARPGEIDALVDGGLEKWLDDQLAGRLPETELDRLGDLHPLGLTASQITETYLPGQQLLRAAQAQGILSRDDEEARSTMRQPGARRDLVEWAEEQGYRRAGELTHALLTQKVLRAVSAENQLNEVLVDFWFNHFNVSLTDPQGRVHVLAYERDAIRPHVLGDFRSMLGATARHPAMLLYLDNALSSADPGAPTLLDRERRSPDQRMRRAGGSGRGRGAAGFGMGRGGGNQRSRSTRPSRSPSANDLPRQPSRGLNENYARELLELHTLGVDGGYTQEDILAVARAFSGWTVLPSGPRRDEAFERLAQARRRGSIGLVTEGEFLFRPDRHDAAKKEVLGVRLPANRGIEDGQDVLDLVAHHPSTARHLASKLAAKFVSDEPPPALVDRLSRTFLDTHGNLRAVLRDLAYSPEFWSNEARSEKIKSPFDLAISAVRAVGATVDDAAGLVDWIDRMGQPLYRYQAPTGFPDTAVAWTNAGALLTRMNFGLAFATGSVQGVDLDPNALVDGKEPESLDQALRWMAEELLPERPVEESLARLGPVVGDPDFSERLSETETASGPADSMVLDQRIRRWEDPFPGYSRHRDPKPEAASELARVLGVLIGSPEFQRQ